MKQYLNPKESKTNRIIRYIVGSIVCILFLVFCFWAGWLWLILLPFIVDYYFFRYINWAWGRDHSNPILRSIISLFGDILYVLIAVSFIFTFFFQNFAIPSSSLEKTLLTGDYLFVSKLKYGPRMPMTPIALPLVHNRIGDQESYLSNPTLGYKRLAGYGQIERNDLVVFNFPAGDTVATKMTNPDYQTLCAIYGRDVVNQDKSTFGEIVYRPIDRRDHYVKRLIGMPGDKLEIRDAQVYINDTAAVNPRQMQLNYLIQTDGSTIDKEDLDILGINYRDVSLISDATAVHDEQTKEGLKSLGFSPLSEDSSIYGKIYEIPLTQGMIEQLKGTKIKKIVPIKLQPEANSCYPVWHNYGWSIDNYGPILIPQKGMTIRLNENNYPIYERCIRAYEGHKLIVDNGKFFIDGFETETYTFAQNYYWMMGDNRHNSADSRAWGFVPEDHIVGTPSLLWLSINDEKPLFSGGIRFSRMLQFITGK